MMMDLIREAPLGQLLRYLTNNRVLLYPEERPDFVLPVTYQAILEGKESQLSSTQTTPAPTIIETKHGNTGDTDPEAGAGQKTEQLIVPQLAADGTILVDWYTVNDPENPLNWSHEKRATVAAMICLYTFAVYAGSAIYTSSELGVIMTFGVSEQKALLPLSLYVLAYGIGPLISAPLSEIPSIGRNPVYAISFIAFVIVSVPTALVNSFNGLLVLRFMQGFFGSPCLANGGASMQDLYSELSIPFAMVVWVSAAYCGPALGPMVSGFAVTAEGWRWSLWEILWLAGPICIFFNLFLAETHAPTILLRRAQRLRARTGSPRFLSASEVAQAHLSPRTILTTALIKPIEISQKDPAVMFVNLYTSLVYGIYYSFFEVFPLVYPPLYGFSLGELGLVFICIIVACVLAAAVYASYLYFYLNPHLRELAIPPQQEHRLKPALIAVILPPIGLFLFGWTADAKIHWIVSVIGITIFSAGVFVILQCISIYIPRSYPMYAASLFAANDFCRSALAVGAIHFAGPLYGNLGVGKGVSILGGVSVLGVVGMWVLWGRGSGMRAKSSFAVG
ncbi:hypothetical protein MMC30_003399 [Trapelia coarctata]|nr:hypothetical protein [Trapelia coarctata]